MTAIRSPISAQELGSLFSAPYVAVQLLGACQGAVFSPGDLQKIILQDSAFCAKVIQTAVATSPGRIAAAAPLSSSLAVLSLPVIKSLALQSARRLVETSFTARQFQFLRELWFYSQVAGLFSRSLAESISYPDPEEAQLTGLFLNIGMLTLFSKHPAPYLSAVGTSLSSKEVRGQEGINFAVDHQQVSDGLISGWQLDSYMADAVSFLHRDLVSCRDASPLIRIARLALEICRSPLELNAEILAAGAALFNFSPAATEELFARVEKSYRPLSPFADDQEDGLKELGRVQKRLTSLVFSLAEQEGIRTQLADAQGAGALARTARHLYLHHGAAREAVFFSVDPGSDTLLGLPSPEQTRLVGALTTPLHGSSLMAAALQSDKLRHSFDLEPGELSLFDCQLIRLGKGEGVVCLPFRLGGELLGGVALGVATKAEAESFATPQFQLLNGFVARAYLALPLLRPPGPGGAGREVDLLPKLIHEISNPLTIIHNYTSTLAALLVGSENEELFPAIENEIRRIGEILRYYGEGKERLAPADGDVDLNALIRALVQSLQPTFPLQKNIEISLDLDPSLRPLKSRALALQQILVNLLNNAVEALDKNGRITLTTRALTAANGERSVGLTLQDNGPGISAEIRGRLFSPVISTKGGGHAGLGLNIVKGMADDLGATINCHSSAEFGSTFHLVFPRIEA